MLFVLSLLTGFSVLSDGHAAIESYASPYLPPLLVEGLQYGFAALVIGALAWGIITPRLHQKEIPVASTVTGIFLLLQWFAVFLTVTQCYFV